jgi:hypothetical protein
MGKPIGGHDRADRRHAKECDEHESDRTAAENGGCATGRGTTRVERMEGDPERLEQGGLVVRDPFGKREEESARPRHERPERAVGGSVAGEADGPAEIRSTGPAEVARTAGVGRLGHDSLAGAIPLCDDTAELVTKDEGAREPSVADAPLEEPVAVRPAQPDRAHPQEDLAGSAIRDGLSMEPDITRRVEPHDIDRPLRAGHRGS